MTVAPPDTALTAFAAEVGTDGPVTVAGCRTRWEVGGPLDAGTRVVHAPSGVVEHQPEEMTVRVRAGTTVEELHGELARRGQRTSLPRRSGTVGGALAVGENDLCALGRGRVRDSVLQVRYVSADGRLVTGGGPTVKNVSGFDLPRLLVGSLGTLGLIGEVILRTNPCPPVSRWLCSSDADPLAVRTLVHAPSAVLWDGTSTWVELEGHAADVDAGTAMLATACSWAPVAGPPRLPPHRWSVSPSSLAVAMADAGRFVASIGVGTAFASVPQRRPEPSDAMVRLTERMTRQFDPTGRLAPGRRVLGAR